MLLPQLLFNAVNALIFKTHFFTALTDQQTDTTDCLKFLCACVCRVTNILLSKVTLKGRVEGEELLGKHKFLITNFECNLNFTTFTAEYSYCHYISIHHFFSHQAAGYKNLCMYVTCTLHRHNATFHHHCKCLQDSHQL